MFAIVEIAGKQFKVAKGERLELPKLKEFDQGDTLSCDAVLMKMDGEKTTLGMPYVAGSLVEFKLVDHGKGEKIRVFKKKAKKRYERTQGHRQQYTLVEVVSVK